MTDKRKLRKTDRQTEGKKTDRKTNIRKERQNIRKKRQDGQKKEKRQTNERKKDGQTFKRKTRYNLDITEVRKPKECITEARHPIERQIDGWID